jgi:hypothetical protein
VNDESGEELIKQLVRTRERRHRVVGRLRPLLVAVTLAALGNLFSYGTNHHDAHIMVFSGVAVVAVVAGFWMEWWQR